LKLPKFNGYYQLLIPVDVFVPGCAARPESIIDGVVTALGILESKRLAMKENGNKTMEKPGSAV